MIVSEPELVKGPKHYKYLINLMIQPFFPMMSVYHLFHLDIPIKNAQWEQQSYQNHMYVRFLSLIFY